MLCEYKQGKYTSDLNNDNGLCLIKNIKYFKLEV